MDTSAGLVNSLPGKSLKSSALIECHRGPRNEHTWISSPCRRPLPILISQRQIRYLLVRCHGSPQRCARRHLSLWGDSNLRSTNISHFNELQLFDLPPIRCALGVLRCEFSYD